MSRSKRRHLSSPATKPAITSTAIPSRALEWLPTVLLATVTLVAFLPVLSCDFVDYDDPYYVTENQSVRAGLTLGGFRWAWTTFHADNWHPLTWLSLMLDAQLFGIRPWAYHLINLVLHLANTLLLYVLLKRMTGAVWRSTLVAAMFAVHPLHVESVAWISERKDVLSSLFGLLAMLAYIHYVRQPSILRYLAVVLGMALSLLAKPMLVTLPFLLLLLDYWPIRRWQLADPKDKLWTHLVLEKVPLVILSIASCVVTLRAQQSGGAVKPLALISLGERFGNALVSYVQYLWQMLVPWDLAPFYPHTGAQTSMAVGAGALLAVLTGLALWQGRRHPYLIVGWLWYLGMLVPVIGLVQVGLQARADRYTYLPLVGIFLLVVWGLADLAARFRVERVALAGAGIVVAVWMVLASIQVQYWSNAITLWEHSLQVTPNNALAQSNLAYQYLAHGKLDQAIRHYGEAVRANPDDPRAVFNLGKVLLQAGDVDKAIRAFEQSIRLDPELAPAHQMRCVALLRAGRQDEALRAGRLAVLAAPDSASAHFNLGNVLLSLGQYGEAIRHYQIAAPLDPNNPAIHYNLGNAYLRREEFPEAIASYRDAVKIDPDYVPARTNLAAVLLTQGDMEGSIQECRHLLRLNPNDVIALASMGLASQLRGEWQEAASYYRRACSLSPKAAEYHCGLAFALHQQGRRDEARREYQLATQLNPAWPRSALQAAWIMATHEKSRFRNGVRAIQTVQQVIQANGENAATLDVLAAAHAEKGQFKEAAAVARRAEEKASAAGHKELAGQIEERLRLYEKEQPFRTAHPDQRRFDTP